MKDNTFYFEIADDLLPFLRDMRRELDTQRLEVELTPAAEGEGSIRQASSYNPEWYSRLCTLYPAPLRQQRTRFRKKPRTKIKRRDIRERLVCLIATKKSHSEYAEFMAEEAQRRKEYYEMDPDLIDWRAETYG